MFFEKLKVDISREDCDCDRNAHSTNVKLFVILIHTSYSGDKWGQKFLLNS